MTCPHCQAPLVSDARYCPACGKETAPTASGNSWPAATQGAPELVGREIAGRFRILKKLGEGGMGAVYRGEQMSLKRACAVKLLRPELGNNPQISQRFNAEAQAVARLEHPNTVNIYDFGHDTDGTLYIAMEYIEGRSLREAIQKEGPFPVQRALAIALQVAASLSDAHAKGIVHRDLKPDNVMLQQRGKQKDVVRVLDFGIAKLRDEGRATQAAMTQAGDMLGTPQYMAPEQIKGETVDGRTDIYALGCMIYEMVTGRLPFEAATIMAMLSKHLVEDPVPPTQRRPELNLPPMLDQLILGAMKKEPNERAENMDVFADHLGALLGQLPPDPNATNRSGGLSVQHSAQQGIVTPPASSFGPPQTPAPMGQHHTPQAAYPAMTPTPAFPPPMGPPPGVPFAPPMGPPPGVPYMPPPPPGAGPIAPTAQIQGYAPPPPPTPVTAKKSKAPLFAILGILVLGGGGAAAFLLTRKDDKAKVAAGSGSAEVANPSDPGGGGNTPDPSDPPDPPDPGGPDPWASDGTPSNVPVPDKQRPPKPPVVDPDDLDPADKDDEDLPVPQPIPKADLGSLPEGATITPPGGFTKLSETPQAIGYMHASTGETITMMALGTASTDPATFAKQYASARGVTFSDQETVLSAGKQRPALAFEGENGAGQVLHLVVLYVGPSYRIGVFYLLTEKAILAAGGDADALKTKLESFFKNGVQLP